MFVLFLQLESKLFEGRTYTTGHNFPSYSIAPGTELNIIKQEVFNTCLRKFNAIHTPRAAKDPASLLQGPANELWCVNQKLAHTGAERHLTSHAGFKEAGSMPQFCIPFFTDIWSHTSTQNNLSEITVALRCQNFCNIYHNLLKTPQKFFLLWKDHSLQRLLSLCLTFKCL